MQFDSRNTATILAALRFWQRKGSATEAEFQLASDDNSFLPLDSDEIDALCEVINTDATLPTAVIEINGGAIYCTRSNVPMRVLVLDEDLENSDEEGHRQIGDWTYYVHYAVLTEQAECGQDGIDAQFVQRVLAQA